jgi:hypothetical protein
MPLVCLWPLRTYRKRPITHITSHCSSLVVLENYLYLALEFGLIGERNFVTSRVRARIWLRGKEFPRNPFIQAVEKPYLPNHAFP